MSGLYFNSAYPVSFIHNVMFNFCASIEQLVALAVQ